MAKGLALLCVLAVVLVFARGTPQLVEFYRMAFQNDPRFPDGEFKLLAGGRELSFSGGIKYGVAEALAQELKAAPEVRVLHLHSPGGRLRDASKLAQLVRERGLETYVSNQCLSACTMVFAAGQRRWLSDAARLGFHGVAMPGMSDAQRQAGNQEWAAVYRWLDVELAFIDKALAVPSDDMWFPTGEELMQAKLVTDMDGGENFQPSGYEAVDTLEKVGASVRRNRRLVAVLHEVAPTTARSIYRKVRRAMVDGTLSEQTLLELDMLVDQLVLDSLPLADDDAIVEFAALTADRYQSVLGLGATACFEAIEGRPLPRGVLTPEVETRTIAVHEKILRTVRKRPAPDPALVDAAWSKTIKSIPPEWLVVNQKTVSELEAADHEPYCRSWIEIHRVAAGLPPEEASALMRAIYRQQ